MMTETGHCVRSSTTLWADCASSRQITQFALSKEYALTTEEEQVTFYFVSQSKTGAGEGLRTRLTLNHHLITSRGGVYLVIPQVVY